MRLPRPDARTAAVVAALAAVSLLVTLIVWRRQDLLGVVLALLCVLFTMIAGVSVAAAREHDDRRSAVAVAPSGHPSGGLHGIDADTLETLDNREAVRAMRERHGGRGRSATGEGG
ncbi:hypothetical protein NCC78_15155 [Micromonospora phytophila]|uniref:hypothetical protein n=1 Tax=Micromonospora phytophila TaxID=709888 RepID=UPI00202E822E|nr:hypothetical protein [Micromonospora phytophila]MCM0676018.1 hypothetical protein [Micromonospora phytophila]